MEKPSIEDKNTHTKQAENESLSNAICQVNAAIDSVTEQMKEISRTEEQDFVFLTGETTTGFAVKMLINPKEVAEIMLKYNYPIYTVLHMDAPQEMWDEIAKITGLGSVYWIHISIDPKINTDQK